MKYFAITPDKLSPEELCDHLPVLQQGSVSHLYLRARTLHTDLERLLPRIRHHTIIPIIPRTVQHGLPEGTYGIHTRSAEQFDSSFDPSGCLQTASCHSARQACELLDKGADYVFISPVYRPFSKPADQRPLIETDALRMITRRYGPRIVLLGGLTQKRIKNLRTMLNADFSIAGISMFFNTGTTHEHKPTADICQ